MTTSGIKSNAALVASLAFCLLVAVAPLFGQSPIRINKNGKSVSDPANRDASLAGAYARRMNGLDGILDTLRLDDESPGRSVADLDDPRLGHARAGFLRFIGAPRQGSFTISARERNPKAFAEMTPEEIGHAFLIEQRHMFVNKSSRVDFKTNRLRKYHGQTYMRVSQTYDEIPVWGAAMMVQIKPGKGVSSVLSDVMRETHVLDNGFLSTTPRLTADHALAAALAPYADDYTNLTADPPQLMIFSPPVVGEPGDDPMLVWQTEVRGKNDGPMPLHEFVLVDAHNGQVVLHYNRICTELNREIWDPTATASGELSEPADRDAWQWPTSPDHYHRQWEGSHHLVRQELDGFGFGGPWEVGILIPYFEVQDSAPPANDAWINNMSFSPLSWDDPKYPQANITFYYAGDTWMFWAANHNRDSFDDGSGSNNEWTNPKYGMGQYINFTVNMEMENAYAAPVPPRYWAFPMWPDYHFVFGAGYGTADDVVAHELTHAMTAHECGLIYMNESGAINESFSDMWGEWVDLFNGSGTDTDYTRWLLGDDVHADYHAPNTWDFYQDRGYYSWDDHPPYGGGEMPRIAAIRDMRNPPYYGHPDRMGSGYFFDDLIDMDNGGVHMNSGVGNKLCYLLTDGDTFNNQQVFGLGYSETATSSTVPMLPPTWANVSASGLMYEVQHLLTPATDYEDLYYILLQAAENLNLTTRERENIDRACAAVEIKPPKISEAFRITYRDKRNRKLEPVIDDIKNEIIIADPNAHGTLKIRRNRKRPFATRKGLPWVPTIRLIQSEGNLTKVYTEGEVDELRVVGDLPNLVAKNCYVKRIFAGEAGKIKMTGSARSWTTGDASDWWVGTTNGEAFYTRIHSRADWNELSIDEGAMPLKLTLSGVGLVELKAPAQTGIMKLSSKTWRRPNYGYDHYNTVVERYSKDVSYGGIPSNYNWIASRIEIGELKKMTIKGAIFNASEFLASARVQTDSKVITKGVVFTPTYMGNRYVAAYIGHIGLARPGDHQFFYSGARSLSVETVGGSIEPLGEMAVAGEFKKISAKRAFVRFPNILVVFGGFTGAPYSFVAPYTANTSFASGVDQKSDRADIMNVFGSYGVRASFRAGVDFNGMGTDDEDIFAIRGNIRQISLATSESLRSTTSTQIFRLTDTSLFIASEYYYITGHGWTQKYPKYKGDHSRFIEHLLDGPPLSVAPLGDEPPRANKPSRALTHPRVRGLTPRLTPDADGVKKKISSAPPPRAVAPSRSGTM